MSHRRKRTNGENKMVRETGSGKVEEYQGKILATPIEYTFTWERHETLAEAKQSEDWPSDNEILKIVNQTAERSAKASAYQKAVADLKKEYENSTEFKQKQFIAASVAMGFSVEEATALAQSKIQ